MQGIKEIIYSIMKKIYIYAFGKLCSHEIQGQDLQIQIQHKINSNIVFVNLIL